MPLKLFGPGDLVKITLGTSTKVDAVVAVSTIYPGDQEVVFAKITDPNIGSIPCVRQVVETSQGIVELVPMR